MRRPRARRRGPLENPIHDYAVQMLRLFAVPNLIWYHCPNEGKRSVRTGAHLKRMGMLPGVADLSIVLPGGKACFLELKRPKGGTMSVDQLAFRMLCERNGAAYAVATTPREVESILSSWGAIRMRFDETARALYAAALRLEAA